MVGGAKQAYIIITTIEKVLCTFTLYFWLPLTKKEIIVIVLLFYIEFSRKIFVWRTLQSKQWFFETVSMVMPVSENTRSKIFWKINVLKIKTINFLGIDSLIKQCWDFLNSSSKNRERKLEKRIFPFPLLFMWRFFTC